MSKFKKDVTLDARMVLAGMRGGPDGILAFAMSNRAIFTTPDLAFERCDWLKSQSDKYISQVAEITAEMEKNQLKIT